MIIIEGMDNSGKTRLAEYLSGMLDIPVRKRTAGPPREEMDLIWDAIRILTVNPRAIFDRVSMISEAVYGPVLRGRNVFDDTLMGHRDYMSRLLKLSPLIIYCRPPDPVIFTFKSDIEQMDGVIDNKHQLLRAYDAFMELLPSYSVFRYDYTSPTQPTEILAIVEAYLGVSKLKRHRGGYFAQ